MKLESRRSSKVTVTIKLDIDLVELLDAFAIKHGITRSEAIRMAIIKLIESNKTEKLLTEVEGLLTPRERDIVEYLKRMKEANLVDMALYFKITKKTLVGYLKRLERLGLVKIDGENAKLVSGKQ